MGARASRFVAPINLESSSTIFPSDVIDLSSDIARAAQILRAGGLVAFPTETVYGLGADASSARAVRKIFAAKGRPLDHPVIVHIRGAQDLGQWATDVPAHAHRLIEQFWPGPLTLVLKRAHAVIDEVTGGQGTVGLRAPSHPVARELLEAFAGGIAAPSANRFGRISPTSAQHVRDDLGNSVDLILDAGSCEVGIESTIVDLSSGAAVLLRPGHIGIEAIQSVLGVPVSRRSAESPRASGTLAAHYAPRVRLRLAAPSDLHRIVDEESGNGLTAVLARTRRPPESPAALWRTGPDDADAFAQVLYASLRELDNSGCAAIVAEELPPTPEWEAVRDRLGRAAAGSGTNAADGDDDAT